MIFPDLYRRPRSTFHGRCCEKPIQVTRHVLYCTVLYFTVLYSTLLYSTLLYTWKYCFGWLSNWLVYMWLTLPYPILSYSILTYLILFLGINGFYRGIEANVMRAMVRTYVLYRTSFLSLLINTSLSVYICIFLEKHDTDRQTYFHSFYFFFLFFAFATVLFINVLSSSLFFNTYPYFTLFHILF